MNKEFPQKKWWNFKETVKEFKEELIKIDRVTRVTAWWRQLRFRASVVIWNYKWTVWLWIGKAWEVIVAIEKAVRDAKKNLIKVNIINWTIAHNIEVKFKASRVMLHPASQWTWIIAGSSIRKILSLVGIKDVLAKRYWSNNPITNARATLKALSYLKNDTMGFCKKNDTIKIDEKNDNIKKENEINNFQENKLETNDNLVIKNKEKNTKEDKAVDKTKEIKKVNNKKPNKWSSIKDSK